MLILNQSMQSKLTNSWTKDYKAEYLAMADDGNCGSTPSSMPNCGISNDNGNAINTGSIVNSLLLKKTGAAFSDSSIIGSNGIGGGGGGGLEQKIQELKAEKEAGESTAKKCPGALNDQDSPLDFSVKRRSSFSGSFTDDSRGSSSSPSNTADFGDMSPPSQENGFSSHHSILSNGSLGSGAINGENGKRTTASLLNEDMFPEEQKLIGQPKVGAPPVPGMPPFMNGMGVFPGLPSSLLGNPSAINAFSQMVAATSPFMDSSRNNKKNNRPFKAYPKEALQMPLGFFGLPGLTNALQQGTADSGMFAGLSSEELMNVYNQQLQMFREKQQHVASSGGLPAGSSSPPAQISTTTPSSNHSNIPNNNNSGSGRRTNGQPPSPRQTLSPQHHQTKSSISSPQHNMFNSSPPSHLPPIGSQNLSPPHVSPRHISPDHHLGMNGSSSSSLASSFPPLPPHHHPSTTSMNGTTLVSSTSSHFSHPNSRKRPRSLPDEQKDDAYWERRRKNNDAAKRSRDARRAKEDEIALRAALLEQENLKLRVEVAALKTETARLRCMLYNG